MKYTFAFIICLLVVINMNAQINMRPGYIITNTNDTIRGLIDFRTAEHNARQCSFMQLVSGERKNYSPGEIYAYRFSDDGKFYVTRSVTIEGVKQILFLEYMIQGIISLYYLPGNPQRYFFETGDDKMVEVSKEDKWVSREDGKSGIQEDTRYVGILTYLFREDEKTKKKVSKISLGKGDLTKLTKEYHEAVCVTGEECIEFEVKPDKKYVRFSFSILAGVRLHHFTLENDFYKLTSLGELDFFSPSLGVEMGVLIPRVSRIFSGRIALEGSLFKGNRMIQTARIGRSEFNSKGILFQNRVGINIAPGKGKMQPYVEVGFAQSLVSNFELINRKETYQNEDVVEVETDYSNVLPRYYSGFYADLGLKYHLQKHQISLSGLYQSGSNGGYSLNTFGVNLRFTF